MSSYADILLISAIQTFKEAIVYLDAVIDNAQAELDDYIASVKTESADDKKPNIANSVVYTRLLTLHDQANVIKIALIKLEELT